jgi:hypothetical protein
MDTGTDPGNDVGKKVFFVAPNSVVQKEMMADLVQQEYEVHLVPDVSKAKQLFAKYPDCIAFLNIDDGLSEEGWEEFIRDVQADPALKQVRLGILTYNSDPELARRYLMEHQVPCGFVKLTLKRGESTAIILKVLEANEARGRRRYLRIPCRDNTRLNFLDRTTTVEGRVVDISSVGMACVMDPDKAWPKHSVLESVQLKLNASVCMVNGIVMGSRRLERGDNLYVILFDPKMAQAQRDKIRTYIQWSLQSAIDDDLRELEG